MQEKTYPFVEYLEGLRDDRAALAALRRGLGRPPGTVPDMYRYVEPWLPAEAPSWLEDAYYLVAALFAYHPAEGGQGNMGDHFARARDPQGDNTAIERRFTALLAAHPDDLPFYLRQAISFLRSKGTGGIPVDWHTLFRDLQGWGYEGRSVQKRWARAFWGHSPREAEQDQTK